MDTGERPYRVGWNPIPNPDVRGLDVVDAAYLDLLDDVQRWIVAADSPDGQRRANVVVPPWAHRRRLALFLAQTAIEAHEAEDEADRSGVRDERLRELSGHALCQQLE